MVAPNAFSYLPLTIEQRNMLEHVSGAFSVSDGKLDKIVCQMRKELAESVQNGDLHMATSFIHSRTTPQGAALGMAIDASGKRIRISSMQFDDASISGTSTQVFIAPSHVRASTSAFFDFVAYCIREFVHSQGFIETQRPLPMGVSIGLPISEHNGSSAIHCRVSEAPKEDSLDLCGSDVARRLCDTVLRNHLPVRITSITNNVVSSLVAAQFSNKTTRVAASFNRGVNAAYFEKLRNIPNLAQCEDMDSDQDRLDSYVAVNTEIGRFGTKSAVLPLTMWDNRIDRESRSPGTRRFEKLVADQYLGEIARNLITDFMDHQLLFTVDCDASKISTSYLFHTAYMAPIIDDTSNDLDSIESLFATEFGISTTLSDRQIIQALCLIVCRRASCLSGAALAALVLTTNDPSCSVALSGVLLNSHQIYKSVVSSMQRHVGKETKVVYFQSKKAEIQGAALHSGTKIDRCSFHF